MEPRNCCPLGSGDRIGEFGYLLAFSGDTLYTRGMKANNLYTRWLSLAAARQGLYQSMTERGLWGHDPSVRDYYALVDKVNETWFSYVAAASGVTKEEVAARINANMHSPRD